jgi:hypothetical protein
MFLLFNIDDRMGEIRPSMDRTRLLVSSLSLPARYNVTRARNGSAKLSILKPVLDWWMDMSLKTYPPMIPRLL